MLGSGGWVLKDLARGAESPAPPLVQARWARYRRGTSSAGSQGLPDTAVVVARWPPHAMRANFGVAPSAPPFSEMQT